MHRYNPYYAAATTTRTAASRPRNNSSPTTPREPHPQEPREPREPHPDDGVEEEDLPGEAEVQAPREAAAEGAGGGKKRGGRGPVSEAVIVHRLALHQVDIGTSGTLAFASTLDHAMRCKT